MRKHSTYPTHIEVSEIEKPHTQHSQQPSEDPLLTVREVAKRVRVDDTTVRRWIKNGALDAVELPHVGKRCAYRVRASTLNAIVNMSTAASE